MSAVIPFVLTLAGVISLMLAAIFIAGLLVEFADRAGDTE